MSFPRSDTGYLQAAAFMDKMTQAFMSNGAIVRIDGYAIAEVRCASITEAGLEITANYIPDEHEYVVCLIQHNSTVCVDVELGSDRGFWTGYGVVSGSVDLVAGKVASISFIVNTPVVWFPAASVC